MDGLPQSTVQQQQVIKQGSPLPEAARGLPQPHPLPHPPQTQQQRSGDPPGPPVLELVTTKRERSPSPSEPLSPDTLNPPSPADSSKDSVLLYLFHCHVSHCASQLFGSLTLHEHYSIFMHLIYTFCLSSKTSMRKLRKIFWGIFAFKCNIGIKFNCFAM